ncbi:MAG: hypothetical protein M3503_06630 [Actinomycetota bacterium]|nr:hypothetical protein [Actinomycetota bacterium]
MDVHLELLVEPFDEGHPGPHVLAALQALEAAGLAMDLGPFASTATGDVSVVAGAISQMLTASMGAGATRITVQLSAAG